MFDVPIGVCDKLDSITRRFWWNLEKDSGGFLAWKSWDKLCRSKYHGGLGFRAAKKINEALIAKLTWMVVSKRVSPCMNALRSKYKVNEDWLNSELMKYTCNTWKAVERMKSFVKNGACFLVGDGTFIDVWKEPWVPWLPNFTPQPKHELFSSSSLKVADLFDCHTRYWNVSKLNELFEVNSVEAIKKILVPAFPKEDKLIWALDPKGIFSVRSALKSSFPHFEVDPEIKWKALWKLKLHDCLKILVWRIALGILPTKLNYAQKLDFGDTKHSLCLNEKETLDHLFFKCSIARAVWFGSTWCLNEKETLDHLFFKCLIAKAVWFGYTWVIRSDHITLSTCQDFLKFVCDPTFLFPAYQRDKALSLFTSIQFALTLDFIWNPRNKVCFDDQKINILTTLKALDLKITEHFQSLDPIALELSLARWDAPHGDVMKLNVDTTIASNKVAIAVVARNCRGTIFKAWAKEIAHLDPLVAEATAIRWALELALSEKFEKVLIKSDAKM